MNARVARAERREAHRILGERAVSVVGALRTEVLTTEQRILKTNQALEDLANAYLQLKRQTEDENDAGARVLKEHNQRLATCERLAWSASFRERLRWLFTGRLP